MTQQNKQQQSLTQVGSDKPLLTLAEVIQLVKKAKMEENKTTLMGYNCLQMENGRPHIFLVIADVGETKS